jgi:hypothetical protein
MGDCVLATAEQGYICDEDYCVLDICGWCNGDNSTCLDCSGVPNGNKVIDVCGLCGGNGDTCCSCADPTFCAPFAPRTDSCGVCGGNGLSCVQCSLGTGGLLGLDNCGVCNGDGSSCLPTFTIQVNFDAPPTPTPSCDACCQVLASVNATLLSMGLSPNGQTLSCILKEACDPVSDPICLPGKTSYTVQIQQVVFEGATLTSADASNLLQTNGLISNTQFGLNLIGTSPTVVVPVENVITVASGPAVSPQPSGNSPSPSPAPAPTPGGSSGGPAAVVVGVTFPSYANGEQLYNNPTQLQTLIDQTIAELISSGQLPGQASDYTGTATFDTTTGAITISITPTSGSYPDGQGASCTTCASGTPITPAICQSICTASVTEVQSPASSTAASTPTINSKASSFSLF